MGHAPGSRRGRRQGSFGLTGEGGWWGVLCVWQTGQGNSSVFVAGEVQNRLQALGVVNGGQGAQALGEVEQGSTHTERQGGHTERVAWRPDWRGDNSREVPEPESRIGRGRGGDGGRRQRRERLGLGVAIEASAAHREYRGVWRTESKKGGGSREKAGLGNEIGRRSAAEAGGHEQGLQRAGERGCSGDDERNSTRTQHGTAHAHRAPHHALPAAVGANTFSWNCPMTLPGGSYRQTSRRQPGAQPQPRRALARQSSCVAWPVEAE